MQSARNSQSGWIGLTDGGVSVWARAYGGLLWVVSRLRSYNQIYGYWGAWVGWCKI